MADTGVFGFSPFAGNPRQRLMQSLGVSDNSPFAPQYRPQAPQTAQESNFGGFGGGVPDQPIIEPDDPFAKPAAYPESVPAQYMPTPVQTLTQAAMSNGGPLTLPPVAPSIQQGGPQMTSSGAMYSPSVQPNPAPQPARRRVQTSSGAYAYI